MNNTQLKVPIPVVLYIKSILLLNGIYDISIKNILTETGFDITKPSKLFFKGNKLKYIYNGIEFNIIFDFCKLSHSNDKKLRITFKGKNDEQRQCLFIKKDKTKLIKDNELINRRIYLNNDNNQGIVISDDNHLCIEEQIHSGLTSDCIIRLKVYTDNNYSKYMDFKFQKHDIDNFYNINNRNYLELQKYLIDLKFPVSVKDAYNKLCEIYSIDSQNITGDYEIYLSISDVKENHFAAYIEDINGQSKIIENSLSTEYRTKGNRLTLNKKY